MVIVVGYSTSDTLLDPFVSCMFLDNSDLQPNCFQCFLLFRRLIPIYHVQCLRSQFFEINCAPHSTMFFFNVITSVLRFFYHVSLSYFFLFSFFVVVVFVLLLSILCVHPVWVILMWQFPNSSPMNAVCHLENWSGKWTKTVWSGKRQATRIIILFIFY